MRRRSRHYYFMVKPFFILISRFFIKKSGYDFRQKIEIVLINRPGSPFLGAGEAAQGPTPAAIANAISAAVGIRLRKIPFTPQRVRAALKSG